MLTLGLIAAVAYLFKATRKNREVALKKGVDEDDLTLFAVFLWLYAFPPVVTFLFVQDYNWIIALVFTVFYIPGIALSSRLSNKLGTGFDYERKAGRDFDKSMWLGIAGIGLVAVNCTLSGVSSLLR
jgi:hypothetical protein